MSNRTVAIKGVSGNKNQFLVQTNDFNVTISNSVSSKSGDGPSPTDYLLAGFAGSINAVGLIVAQGSEEHTSELQSHHDLVCRLLLEKKKNKQHK